MVFFTVKAALFSSSVSLTLLQQLNLRLHHAPLTFPLHFTLTLLDDLQMMVDGLSVLKKLKNDYKHKQEAVISVISQTTIFGQLRDMEDGISGSREFFLQPPLLAPLDFHYCTIPNLCQIRFPSKHLLQYFFGSVCQYK